MSLLSREEFLGLNFEVEVNELIQPDIANKKLQSTQDVIKEAFNYSNIFLSGVGILLNVMIFFVLVRVPGKMPTRRMLTCCLTLSDMCVGLYYFLDNGILHAYLKSSVYKHRGAYKFVMYELISLGRLSSLFSMFFLAVDLYVAVHIPFRYKITMSRKKGGTLVGVVWWLSAGLTAVTFLVDYFRQIDLMASKVSNLLAVLISLLVLGSLVKVNLSVYRQIQSLHRRRSSRHKQNSKGLVTLLLIILTYALFVLPFSYLSLLEFILLHWFRHWHERINWYFTFIPLLQCLVVINSICDPLIYAFRMPEIKRYLHIA